MADVQQSIILSWSVNYGHAKVYSSQLNHSFLLCLCFGKATKKTWRKLDRPNVLKQIISCYNIIEQKLLCPSGKSIVHNILKMGFETSRVFSSFPLGASVSLSPLKLYFLFIPVFFSVYICHTPS